MLSQLTIVDVVVCPFIGLFNLLLQILWEELDLLVLLWQQLVEFMVEHADDLTGLIADNGLLLLVPESWDGEACRVVFIRSEIDVAQMSEILVQRIWGGILARHLLV